MYVSTWNGANGLEYVGGKWLTSVIGNLIPISIGLNCLLPYLKNNRDCTISFRLHQLLILRMHTGRTYGNRVPPKRYSYLQCLVRVSRLIAEYIHKPDANAHGKHSIHISNGPLTCNVPTLHSGGHGNLVDMFHHMNHHTHK